MDTQQGTEPPTHLLAHPSYSPHQWPDPLPPGLPACPRAFSALIGLAQTRRVFQALHFEYDRAFLSPPAKSSKQKLQREPDLGKRTPASGQSGGHCLTPARRPSALLAPHQRDSPWCPLASRPAHPAFRGPPTAPKFPPPAKRRLQESRSGAWPQDAPLPLTR